MADLVIAFTIAVAVATWIIWEQNDRDKLHGRAHRWRITGWRPHHSTPPPPPRDHQ